MNKKFILTLNCGSSSIKFALFYLNNINKYIYGKLDLINTKDSYINYSINNENKILYFKHPINYKSSIEYIYKNILFKYKVINLISGIGHRVVHGGNKFKKSTKITKDVILDIEKFSSFAPLHNPINIMGIKESINLLPNLYLKNVAVFDTSFYQNIPKYAYLYGIPYFLYKNHNIRRYGAHGISNYYIVNKYSEFFNIPINKLNLIICHLGNGSSISAIKNGKCIDTSMGLTPLEGLLMGTRCGDIDPSIIFYLYNKLKMSIHEIEQMLINKSGLLGLTEITNDLRVIENYYFNKNKKAIMSLNIYCYKLIKYIGSYFTILNSKINSIIFTGGIGENSYLIRKLTLNKLYSLGIYIDNKRNENFSNNKIKIITKDSSKISSVVIPTNEEYIIAKETINLLYD